MVSLAVETPLRERTEAFPPPTVCAPLTGVVQPFGLPSKDSVVVTFVPEFNYYVISGGTLTGRMALEGYLLLGLDPTTSSRPPLLLRRATEKTPGPPSVQVLRTAARAAIEELQAVSGLTKEEIAPLAGVSRRSIQAWVAGESISARKEQRLRALLDAIRALADTDAEMTRRRLLDRVPGDVRPYDVLADGRFDEAVDLALRRRQPGPVPAALQAQDLYAQLDHNEGRVELQAERLDRRFSRQLRR